MRIRGFEVVSRYQNKGINLPQRQTKNAAGYDFECAEDFLIPSIWHYNFIRMFHLIRNKQHLTDDDFKRANDTLKSFLVPTGIKAYMQPNEVLILAERSSNPLKRNLILPNGIGVIDADYYNNVTNEGEIFVQLINYGPRDRIIHKGERIAQGIFMPYLTVDNEKPIINERKGNFGSTDTD